MCVRIVYQQSDSRVACLLRASGAVLSVVEVKCIDVPAICEYFIEAAKGSRNHN